MSTITLPAGFAGVVVKPLYEHELVCGVAFASEVVKDGVVIGTIENSGNGGGTDFRHHNADALKWWLAGVAEFTESATLLVNESFVEAGLPAIDGMLNSGMVSEVLADFLTGGF